MRDSLDLLLHSEGSFGISKYSRINTHKISVLLYFVGKNMKMKCFAKALHTFWQKMAVKFLLCIQYV